MDHGRFADLTRSPVGGSQIRRADLRLSAGGALGGLAALVGGLLWAVYGVCEMLQPWGPDTAYRDELGYEVITDALLHLAYSLPGSLALLLTSLSLLAIFRLLGAPAARMGQTARVLASIALALAVLSMVGVVGSFDPLFTAPRIFGTLALGAATCLAGAEVWPSHGVSGWGIALTALGLLGLFLLPLWPLVHALAWMPASGGAGFIALYGMGWTLTGSRLWFGPIEPLCLKKEVQAMDHGHFDSLTRSMVGGPESRRTVLRLLAGGALAAAMAQLGLTADADAKPRTSKAKTGADRRRPGAVRSEGKKGKGKKGRGKDKDGPKPRDCGPGKKPCPDGGCVVETLCCPGERMCAGGRCQRGCCADEWECPGGACIDPLEECCPGQKPCEGNVCIAEDDCCPDAPAPLCTDECEDIACRNGFWVCEWVEGCESPPTCEDSEPCRPGYHYNAMCNCVCPGGHLGCGGWCCPDSAPYCNEGDNWNRLCRTEDWQLACPLGYSPQGEGYCTLA